MHRLNFMQTTSLGHSPGSKKETNQETIRPLYLQNTFSLKNVLVPSASAGLKAWQMTLWLWCCEVRFRVRELRTDTPPNWAVLGGCSAPWNLGQTPPTPHPQSTGELKFTRQSCTVPSVTGQTHFSSRFWISHIIFLSRYLTLSNHWPEHAQAPGDASLGVTASRLTLQS